MCIISLRMNLLSVVLSILFIKCFLAIQTYKEIDVNFNDTVWEFNEIDFVSRIQFNCPTRCKWIIPKRIEKENQLSIDDNNYLSLSFNNSQNIVGNYTICELGENENSSIEYYDIPSCCPCCPWYYQTKCDTFFDKTLNCSTVVIYSVLGRQVQFFQETIYENTQFLVPCKKRQIGNKRGLKILDELYDGQYLNYNGTKIEFIHKDFSYNPTVGLCLNTSQLKQLSYVKCQYELNKTATTYIFKKIDFLGLTITKSLNIIDRLSRKSTQILESQSVIKLLKNQSVELECRAKYELEKAVELMMCMKFERLDIFENKTIFCQESNGELKQTLLINTSDLKNHSRFYCQIQNPSKVDSQQLDLIVLLFEKESLTILNFKRLNNETKIIFENQTSVEFDILFESIPSDIVVECQARLGRLWKKSCGIVVVGKCTCKIDREILRNLSSKLRITVSNKKITKSIFMVLKKIYLQTPKLMGLNSKFEKYKHLYCNSSSSKPYNVSWKIELNNEEKFRHQSTINIFTIQLNENVTSICIVCGISNGAGSKFSNEVCVTITDIEISDDKTFEIFLVNATIWDSKNKKVKVIQHLADENNKIQVLDTGPIVLICASRHKEWPLAILFNNSNTNFSESVTKYTRQSRLEFSVDLVKKENLSGLYICHQRNANKSSVVNSTISITILRTIKPKFMSTLKEQNEKQEFIIGQNIHIFLTLISFPSAKITLFILNGTKFVKFLPKNLSLSLKRRNSTHTNVSIIFSSIDKADSGQYLLKATNIAGNDSYIFTLDLYKPNLKLYYTIAGVFVAAVTIFGLFVMFFQRSSYAVPIIQIQNNMYKSLDIDSLQLINNIWPDPLDRKKWTIKPSSRLRIIDEIGEGNYGRIYKGILVNPKFSSEEFVAIKEPILSNQSSKGKVNETLQFCQISLDCFMNEIRILSKLVNCPNIIKMYGCVVFPNGMGKEGTVKEPVTLLVLEYCTNRSLSEFLNKNASMFSPYTKFRKLTEPNGYTGMKIDEGITLLDLKRISLGVATGLDYLSGLSIIHRDLAPRNILIDEAKNPKICDFGLAIELENEITMSTCYQILTHNKALPFKILAPEVLESRSFYLESDTWSFGLLLWQIFNLDQETLFPQCDSPSSLLKYIRSRIIGEELKDILILPKYADEPIWELIKACLVFMPFSRPSAHLLRARLMEIVRSSPVEVIRVSSNCNSESNDSPCRDSLGSSRFPSTRTSTITLNYPITVSNVNNTNTNSYFIYEFPSEALINESPL